MGIYIYKHNSRVDLHKFWMLLLKISMTRMCSIEFSIRGTNFPFSSFFFGCFHSEWKKMGSIIAAVSIELGAGKVNI